MSINQAETTLSLEDARDLAEGLQLDVKRSSSDSRRFLIKKAKQRLGRANNYLQLKG